MSSEEVARGKPSPHVYLAAVRALGAISEVCSAVGGTLPSVSVPVPLDGLAAALARRSNAAYLLTVGDDGRAHCVATAIEWLHDEIVVAAGATSLRNAAARGNVVLLAPPVSGLLSGPASPAVGGDAATTLDTYSLIVDVDVTGTTTPGNGAGTGSGRTVRVRPTHAVFHRPALAPASGQGHDCVHVYDEPAPEV